MIEAFSHSFFHSFVRRREAWRTACCRLRLFTSPSLYTIPSSPSTPRVVTTRIYQVFCFPEAS